MPPDFGYLAEKSVIRAVVDLLTEAGKKGLLLHFMCFVARICEGNDKKCVRTRKGHSHQIMTHFKKKVSGECEIIHFKDDLFTAF